MNTATWIWIVATSVFWLVSFAVVHQQQRRVDRYEPTDLDKLQASAAQINVEALAGPFQTIIENYERARYTGNLLYLPQTSLASEVFEKTLREIQSEQRHGYRRQLNLLEVGKPKVRPVNRAQMFAVTELSAVASIKVAYTYYHAGAFGEEQDQFTKRYLFRNEVDGWKIFEIQREEVIA